MPQNMYMYVAEPGNIRRIPGEGQLATPNCLPSWLQLWLVCLATYFRVQERPDIQDVGHFAARIVDKSNATIDGNRRGNQCQKSMQNRSWGASRGAKIDPKIAPGSVPGHPAAPKELPGTIRTVADAPRECPGSVPGAPGGSPRAPRDDQKDSQARSGTRRGNQNRRRVASGSEKIEFFSHNTFEKASWNDFSSIFVGFRLFCKI